MRLIGQETFSKIKNDGKIGAWARIESLQAAGKTITIDDAKIQADLQSVANNSSSSGLEHQVYIGLDRDNARITSIIGEVGIHNEVQISSYPAPVTGVSFIGKPGGLVLIAQAHGHPVSQTAGVVTAKTMSDKDANTSSSLQIPIYGVDAMDGATNGQPTGIHRVTPDGAITKDVGKTSNGFNIGGEALKIWGTTKKYGQ